MDYGQDINDLKLATHSLAKGITSLGVAVSARMNDLEGKIKQQESESPALGRIDMKIRAEVALALGEKTKQFDKRIQTEVTTLQKDNAELRLALASAKTEIEALSAKIVALEDASVAAARNNKAGEEADLRLTQRLDSLTELVRHINERTKQELTCKINDAVTSVVAQIRNDDNTRSRIQAHITHEVMKVVEQHVQKTLGHIRGNIETDILILGNRFKQLEDENISRGKEIAQMKGPLMQQLDDAKTMLEQYKVAVTRGFRFR